jgi:rare lipoprotein A
MEMANLSDGFGVGLIKMENAVKTILLAVVAILALTASSAHHRLCGVCSYYSDSYEGKKCADNRTIFRQRYAYSAHCTLPFGTEITISNCNNGRVAKSVVVDRGPFDIESLPKLRQHRTRVLDVSKGTAILLGFTKQGTCDVVITVTKYGK